MTHQQAKSTFDQDGFVVLRDYLTADARKTILNRTRRFIADVVPTIEPERVFYEDRSQPDTMLRVEHLDREDPWFAELRDAGPIRELAEHMLEGPVQPQGVGIFGKAPRIGKLTPPHQDAYYWRIRPKDALTIWLAIDRADEGNGCVRYVPGSHRQEMRPHELSGVFGFSQHIVDFDREQVGEDVPVCVDPGELIVHHCMTIHRADPNQSERLRRALGLVYYADHVEVDDSDPKFDAKKKWANEGKL